MNLTPNVIHVPGASDRMVMDSGATAAAPRKPEGGKIGNIFPPKVLGLFGRFKDHAKRIFKQSLGKDDDGVIEIKMASELEETCTALPIYKAFRKWSVVKMEYQYQVFRIEGFVKWEVDDGATAPTYAQLTIRRQNLQSNYPWKKPIDISLATHKFAERTKSCSPSPKETKFDVDEENHTPSDLFWKPGNKGKTRLVRTAS